MRRIIVVVLIVIASTFGILFLGLFLNNALDDKYLYDSNLPNVNAKQVADLFKERMDSAVSFAFAMLIWGMVLTILYIKRLISDKKS